jgi:hypothetical protein
VLAVILAWVLALLAAMVILGFCAYELTWKLRRLRTDADKLERTVADLAAVQAELNAIQQRAAGLRKSPQTVSEG